MKNNVLVLFCGAMLVSGCMGGDSDYTTSAFLAPTSAGAAGQIPVALSNEVNENLYRAGYGGAAMVTGTTGKGAVAYAGLLPGSDGGAQVPNGSVTYTGDYEVISIKSISVSGNLLRGRNDYEFGNVTLVGDFDNGTLKGRSGTFVVDGKINGTTLSGNVRYDSTDGALAGVIGQDAAVGAFHGNGDTTVFAGGFVATK